MIEVDDCNFHECVKLNDFEVRCAAVPRSASLMLGACVVQSSRILSFVPPDGEFVVMNYRITGDFRVPFRVFPFFELVSSYKVELIVKVRADIPENSYGGNVVVSFPVPKSTSRSVDRAWPVSAQTCCSLFPSALYANWARALSAKAPSTTPRSTRRCGRSRSSRAAPSRPCAAK